MGVFHVFKIFQMVLNRSKHDHSSMNYATKVIITNIIMLGLYSGPCQTYAMELFYEKS